MDRQTDRQTDRITEADDRYTHATTISVNNDDDDDDDVLVVMVCLQLLTTLDITGNQIKTLISDVRQLRSLEILLAAGNQIQSLPKNFDYLYTLRILNVSGNALTGFVVPKSVVDVDLSDNPLLLPSTDVRHSMFTRMAADASIHSRTVTSLNASRLQLVDLPPVVARLKCLAALDISHNKLKV